MSKRILANLAVFVAVFVVMCVWAVRNVITVDAIEDPYEIELELPAASGLASNAEVAYLGVNYGRIGSIGLVDGGVRATLKIDDGRRIPEGSIARVFRKSAIGEPYIDFQPPAEFDFDDGDYYAAGEVVPVEDTRIPIEFSELLRTASRLISTIEPERAATLLHELALGLEGRGEDLRTLTVASDTLAATFAERTEALDRLATNNTRLTAVVSEHRGSLGQSLTDLADLAESLRAAGGDTRILLDRGTALLGEVGDLVHDARPSIDCLLADLVVVNERGAQPAHLDGLARHLEIGPTAYAMLETTRDIEPDGPWVRVNLLVEPAGPPDQHDPPLDLPAVPDVPECGEVRAEANTAAAPAGDLRIEDLLEPSRGSALGPVRAGVAASVAMAVVLPAAVAVRRRWRRSA